MSHWSQMIARWSHWYDRLGQPDMAGTYDGLRSYYIGRYLDHCERVGAWG